ncbi:small ribosomal subunit protein uS9m [Diabrotica undecimpunctata]|uniref:small ribosomal subunit protein uS9m n=1 Tax=Diabrotica undecimpunctata TaxID=50387 RepID=UPI003B640FA5
MFLPKINRLIDPLKSLTIQKNISAVVNGVQTMSSTVAVSETKNEKKTISKAMKAYLERAKEHDEFMKKQKEEFLIGKRHLANMMGEDPETFTQEDVDNAIAYLFPSGLFEPKARPHMKPPEEIFPQRKAAEFDETGRPYHFLFYTGKPSYYQVLHDITGHINDLIKFEDTMIRKNLQPDPNLKFDMSGFQWLDKQALETKFVETLKDRDYEYFITSLDRLSAMPYSYKVKDFILEYANPLINKVQTLEAPKANIDKDGRQFVTIYECMRKRSRGDVTIKLPGTGKISINGEDISYFKEDQPREQLLFPLIFTNMLNKVDVECNVVGSGESAQAGALRWGIASGLRSFVDEEMIEKMRLAGLLTKDFRTRERKKPGQWGARRKFTWKKR